MKVMLIESWADLDGREFENMVPHVVQASSLWEEVTPEEYDEYRRYIYEYNLSVRGLGPYLTLIRHIPLPEFKIKEQIEKMRQEKKEQALKAKLEQERKKEMAEKKAQAAKDLKRKNEIEKAKKILAELKNEEVSL